MDITIRLHPEAERKLDEIIRLLHRLLRLESHMAGELDALQAQVERNTSVSASAVVLLNGIKAELDAAIAAADWPRVIALTSTLGTNVQELADAVEANTPAVP